MAPISPLAPLPPTAPPAPLAIIAALEAELAPLAAAMTGGDGGRRSAHAGGRITRAGGRRIHWGELAGQPVVLAATGDGAAAAAEGLAALLAAARPGRLLILGVAGGLSPGLAEGALVAARRVVEAGSRAEVPAPDQEWLARLVSAGAVEGTVVTSGRVAVERREKESLWRAVAEGRRQEARQGPALPAVVDLESAVYARLAGAAGAPYAVLRAVLDGAEEELPLDFNRARGRDGRVSRARVLALALAQPRALPAVLGLRRRLARCASRLAEVTVALLAAERPAGAERTSGAERTAVEPRRWTETTRAAARRRA